MYCSDFLHCILIRQNKTQACYNNISVNKSLAVVSALTKAASKILKKRETELDSVLRSKKDTEKRVKSPLVMLCVCADVLQV